MLVTHPVSLPRVAGDATSGDPVRLRVISINVLYANGDHASVLDFIRRERPDAVALMEMNPSWRTAMAPLQKDYPFQYQTIEISGTGASRSGRVCRCEMPACCQLGVRQEPAIQATLQAQERQIRVFAVHTTWPIAPNSAARRNAQLEQLAEQAPGGNASAGGGRGPQHFPVFAAFPAAPEGWRGSVPGRTASAGSLPGLHSCPRRVIQIDHALVNSRVAVEHFSVQGLRWALTTCPSSLISCSNEAAAAVQPGRYASGTGVT